MSTTITSKVNKIGLIKMILTIGIPIIVLCVGVNETFTPTLRLYLAITLFAILAFAFENFNQTVVALALPFAYTLCHIAPASTVYSGWSSNVPWMVLGGIMLADMAVKAGFLDRIAFKCIILTGGTYRGIVFGLALAGLLLNMLLSGNGLIPIAALGFGICKALNLGVTRTSAGVMMAGALGAFGAGSFTFNPGFFVYASFAPNFTPSMSWLDFFTKQAVGIIYFLVVIVLLEKMCRPKEGLNGKEYFTETYQKLGKMTLLEKKAGLICLILLVFLMTGNIHGIPVIWGFGVIPLLAYLPGIAICNNEDISKTNFSIIFFTTACMSIGSVGATLGIGDIVSEIALPILTGKSVSFIFFFIYVTYFLLNFIMTPMAIAAAFTMPFVEIIIQLGINPEAFILFQLQALDQIILPYEYVMYLIVFSFGVIPIKEFVKIMTMKTLCCTAYLFLLLIPYWRLIGFLYN